MAVNHLDQDRYLAGEQNREIGHTLKVTRMATCRQIDRLSLNRRTANTHVTTSLQRFSMTPSDPVYYRKSLGLLSEIERHQCYVTNMGPFGMMQDRLDEYRHSRTRAFALMIWDGDTLVSWALKYWKLESWHVYVYTRPLYRRLGYGKFLLAEARRGMRTPIKVYPWDSVSAGFFATVNPSKIINCGTEKIGV